ncbi:MAG: hypothetical protein AAF269_01770, partial [Pseudomonadota bacterium]
FLKADIKKPQIPPDAEVCWQNKGRPPLLAQPIVGIGLNELKFLAQGNKAVKLYLNAEHGADLYGKLTKIVAASADFTSGCVCALHTFEDCCETTARSDFCKPSSMILM